MAHLRQSRPDYRLVFQMTAFKNVKLFPLLSEAAKNSQAGGDNCITKMCSGSEKGSYSRLIDFCIAQL